MIDRPFAVRHITQTLEFVFSRKSNGLRKEPSSPSQQLNELGCKVLNGNLSIQTQNMPSS